MKKVTKTKIVHKYLSFRNATILEIGCDTGRFSHKILLDTQYIIAIDNNLECIKIAKNNINTKRIKFILTDANEIKRMFSNDILIT